MVLGGKFVTMMRCIAPLRVRFLTIRVLVVSGAAGQATRQTVVARLVVMPGEIRGEGPGVILALSTALGLMC